MDNFKVWENQVEDWEKNPCFSIHNKKNEMMNWIKQIPKGKILDQGCGIGRYTIPLAELGFEPVGFDFSKKLLKIAKKNTKKYNVKCKFIQGDIRKMPFKNKSFDSILSPGTIEHVPETEKTISELSRVLKKNGYLLIHVPHKISVFTITKKIQQFLGIWKCGYEKSFTKNYFSNLLKENGFEIQDYFLSEFKPGKHKIIGKIIQILDKPLYLIGLGGHHMHFLAKKIK